VIAPEERAQFMAGYKAAAGLVIDTLNSAPPTIPKGARSRTLHKI
jgi:5-methylphenazine-1-carboxylate 1-monooxygenase